MRDEESESINAKEEVAARFSGLLDRLMKENGLDQSQMARELKITPQHVWKLRQQRGLPGWHVLMHARRRFGIDLNDLLDEAEPLKEPADMSAA